MAFTSQPMNSFHFATSGFVIVALTKAERNRDSAWDMLDSGAQWAKQQRQFREGESGMKKNRYFPFPLLPLSSRSADLFHREEPRGVGACLETALDIFTSSVKAAPLLVFCEEKREFFTLD